MNNETYGKLLDAGFDWLTMTSTPKMPEHIEFKQAALEFVQMARDSGLKYEEKTVNNYVGYQCGETFYGERADSAMWRTSGGLSRHVAAHTRLAGLTPRITRCDLQETILSPGGEAARLRRILDDARKARIGDAKTDRQKRAEFYEKDCVVGSTLGGRSSEIYLRIYRADIRHPALFFAPALRCEVEFKGARAQQIWEQYYSATNDVALSCSHVAGEFLRKGIKEPLQAEYAPCGLPPIGRNSSDAKTVNWLTTSVCKTIARLIKAGYANEIAPAVMAALTPVPDVQYLSGTLGAEIEKTEWEKFINEQTTTD